jgi:HD-like signal output (HDOD) protein
MELNELILQSQRLVSLPEVYYRAQELLNDPKSDRGLLAKVIETDSGLSARLLRIANSPFFGLNRRVDRISYAINLIGENLLHDLILSTVVLRAFRKISIRVIDLNIFWHHSVYCGLAARKLAAMKGVLHTERMLAMGVMHDIGQLLMYMTQPELATRALLLAEPVDDGMALAEREFFGFDHAEAGAALLQSWRIPESLHRPIACHHKPGDAGDFILDASLLHLANAIANRVEPGRRIESCQTRLDPVAFSVTGLGEDIFEDVIQSADESFLQTLNILMPGDLV